MRKEKTGVYFAVALFLGIFLIASVSAGFFDFFKITGKATAQPTNVSVTITGINIASIIFVSAISTGPVEATYRAVYFNATLYDQDGFTDINFSSVNANFTKSGGGEARKSTTCLNSVNYSTYYANFSCTIQMWYWDANAVWNVSVAGTDLGNKTLVYNSTTSFTYNLLQAMVISPSTLTWSALSTGATNQTSNNDPTAINNTGNYNSTIKVTAIDLFGESNPLSMIGVSNFTTSKNDGTVCASGTVLVNSTATTISGVDANRGNLSAGSGAGQSNLYYCIPLVPNVPSQVYSTQLGGNWTIAYA